MGEKKTFGADMRISGLGVFSVEDGTPEPYSKIKLERLETDHFTGQLDDLEYRAEELSIDTLQTGRGQTTAESLDLGSLEARSKDGNIEIVAHRIGCPSGLLFTSDEELFAPHASVEDAHIIIHDLGKLGEPDEPGDKSGDKSGDKPANESGDKPSTERPAEKQPAEQEPMSWHFLDALQGKLDLDLILDMTLPWIGQRRATHYFRVPIEDGTIDYEKLEDDVHWLESAFLTVERVDDTLVLTRDLPLVPYSGKALLVFPLEPEDVPIAAYRRVHLRNLVRPQVPKKSGKASKKDGKSRLTLHSLSLDNIKLSLHTKSPTQIAFPNGAILQLGDEEQPGLMNLEVTGALHYRAEEEHEPTTLSGHIELVDVTIKDLPLGSSLVSADRLHMSAIDTIEIVFEGFRPRRLELRASRMAATNLRVQLAQR